MSLFMPQAKSVLGELDSSDFPAREFRIALRDGSLTDAQTSQMIEFAELRAQFPARSPHPGRSQYAHRAADESWPHGALKMKGAAGLKFHPETEAYSWTLPEPGKEYGMGRQIHFKLTPNLKVQIALSSRKARYSLTAAQAANEFECQNRLAAAGIGYRGLLAGEYFDASTKAAALDFEGRKTGAVFLEHDPQASQLGRHLWFVLFDEPQSHGAMLMLPGKAPDIQFGIDAADKWVSRKIGFIGQIGEMSRRTAVEAGVGRHSATMGNFWWNSGSDGILVTDTDSCLHYANLAPNEKGPQLLRDAASNLNHCIDSLTYSAFSAVFQNGLEQGRFKPFHAFLGGYFAGLAAESSINHHAGKLHDRYLDFIDENYSSFSRFADALRQGMATGHFRIPEQQLQTNWSLVQKPFLTDCLVNIYLLMQESSLSAMGFPLSRIQEYKLRPQFQAGIDRLMNELMRKSDQIRRDVQAGSIKPTWAD